MQLLNRLVGCAVALGLAVAGPVRACAAPAQLQLTVAPARSLVDAPLSVRISHAAPNERIVVTAQATRGNAFFGSQTTFVADEHGDVDLATAAPVSGSYAGADAMGAVWSMTFMRQANQQARQRDSHLEPFIIRFDAVAQSGQRATGEALRLAVAPSVVRQPVNDGSLIGTLFFPGDGRPHAGVLVLNGSEGGLSEDRAALLASHGFSALVIAYFGIDPLPKNLINIPVERVKNALQFMASDAHVRRGKIAVLGASKGAELALLAASRYPQIGAVVAYAPSSVVFSGIGPSNADGSAPSSWSENGIPLPFADAPVPPDVNAKISADFAAKRPASIRPRYLARMLGAKPEASIPVERINGPIMLVAGAADALWPSDVMAVNIMARRLKYKHQVADQLLLYPNAGHPIGPPYRFTAAEAFGGSIALGGTPEANEQADVDSWPKVLDFLSASLTEPTTDSKNNRTI